MNPRLLSCSSSSASSYLAAAHLAGTPEDADQHDQVEDPDDAAGTTPETEVPTSPVTCAAPSVVLDLPGERRARRGDAARASANTIVEWPSEKKKPTLSGRWPSVMSLRVVLSIAAMWSASNA